MNYLEAFERKNRKIIPLHRSIERMGWIRRLFSFAVVRQVFLLFILLCYMDDYGN